MKESTAELPLLELPNVRINFMHTLKSQKQLVQPIMNTTLAGTYDSVAFFEF